MTSFRGKQLRGVAGAAIGMAVTALVLLNAHALFPTSLLPADDTPSRLVFCIRWLLVPGICLMIGIVAAARRGFYADAIDGTRTPQRHSLEINLRYNQNTLEQTVLAAIAWLGLVVVLERSQLLLIPAMASLCCVGRIPFWIGYLMNPVDRAFGMVITMLPSEGALLWLLWHAIAK